MNQNYLTPARPWLALLILSLLSGHPALFAQPCANSDFVAIHTLADVYNFIDTYQNCDEITGTVYISDAGFSDVTDLSFLSAIKKIGENLEIDNADALVNLSGLAVETIGGMLLIKDNDILTSLQGLESLTTIGGVIMITGNPSLESVNALSGLNTFGNGIYEQYSTSQLPFTNYERGAVIIGSPPTLVSLNGLLGSVTSIPGRLSIRGNGGHTDLAGLENITSVHSLSIQNSGLTSLNGLNQLTSITGGSLTITNNPYLTDLTALEHLTSPINWFHITYNPALTSLSGLDNIDLTGIYGYVPFNLLHNPALSDCAIESICAWLDAVADCPDCTYTLAFNDIGCENAEVVADQCSANSNSNGNWNAAATWDNNYVPASGTTVVINSGHTVSIQNTDNAVAKCLSFGNSGKLEINGMLTLTGGDPIQLVPEDCTSGSATICGTGTINGISIPSPCGIIINPGNSPGIFHIDGDFNNMGGTVQIEIDGNTPDATYDQLQVSGDATIGPDAQLQIDFGFLPASTDVFDIILANSITGAFAPKNITITGITYTSYNLSYPGGNTVQLSVTVLPLPTPNCQDIPLPLNASGQATLTPEMVDPQAAPPTDPFIWSVSQANFTCSDLPGPSAWMPVGGTGISAAAIDYPSLAIAPDGTPYVAYQDLGNDNKTTVLQWNGAAWQALGGPGISVGEAHYQSLAIAPDGTPYVAYRDEADDRKTTVLQWNGATWASLGGQGISAGSSHDQSLAIAPDGTPYVAYRDEVNGNKTTVLQWNGAAWAALGGIGISAGEAHYQSLAITPDGTPYVAYSDWSDNRKTTVLQWNGAAWAALGGIGISAGEAHYQSLAIAPDSAPYVAYQDWSNDKKTIVLFWNGAIWAALGSEGISAGLADGQSLAIAPDGTPYVAYRDQADQGNTVVLKWDGAAWAAVGGPDIPADDTEQPSLGIGPNGIPFVAFLDEDNGDGMTALQYAPTLPTATLTVMDASGNSASCTITVTVADNEAPAPDADPLPEITGDCGTILTPPTATDNCAGPLTAATGDPLSFGSPGAHIVTWTYDDGNGNTTTQTQTVIITDDIPPTLTCQDVALTLDNNGQAALTPEMIAPDLSDNCGYPSTYLSHTLFGCDNLGSPGPNYALEFLGLRREYVQFMSPLTGYADFTLEAWFVNENMQDVFPTYLISWLGTGLEVFDNEGDLYVGLGNVLAQIPVTTRDGQWHHIAIVKEGNTAIVYLDGESQWTSPANANVNLFVTDAFQLGRRFSTAANGQGPWMGRADELRIWNTARSALEIQGARFNRLSGTEAGLAGYWPLDDGPGSLAATDASLNGNHGALSNRLIQDEPWVDGAPLTTGNAASVLLTATDAAGNTSSCMATVSIEAGSLQARCRDIYVQLDENGQASISPEDVDFGSHASCSALSMTVSPAGFTCEDVGINVVTLTVTDDDGNTDECTAQVTVGQGFLLYGSSALGGGSLFSLRTDGSDFTAYDQFSPEDFGALANDPYRSPNIIYAPDGFIYGTTTFGGSPDGNNAYGSGSLFRVRPDGSGYEILHDFDFQATDGAFPYFRASLYYGANCGPDNFGDCFIYGTTEFGGTNGGTIFRYRPGDGLYEVIHNFGGATGWRPWGGLAAGNDGFLYGTLRSGAGVPAKIYRLLPPLEGEQAEVSIVYTFDNPNQGGPPENELRMGADGWLYGVGTTGGGGAGTLFRLHPETLAFEEIYTYLHPTGGFPRSTPIPVDNGYLYGTASAPGGSGRGVIYRIRTDVPAPADTYEPLKYINILGRVAFAGLAYAPDGYLYGAAYDFNGAGAVFRIHPDDPEDFTYIHTFDGAPAGNPTNRLILVPTSCCDDDLFAPELTCPSAIELIDLDGNGTEPITDLAALGFSAFDDCTEATMSIGPEVFPPGSTDAIVTAVDEGGNTATCLVTVMVTGPCTDEEMKIITSDGAGKYFGNSVGISGARAIVGAYGDNVNGNNSGSAYIYHWNGFEWEEYKLIPGDGNAGDYFGLSVAISGDKAIVGAYGDDDNGSSSGSAYLFHWNGANWVQQQKITAADGAFGDNFGYSVAIEGETAIVGAYRDDGNGSAYLFYWDGASWAQQQKITASDGAANDYFGRSVAIDAGRAIVGAYLDDDNGEASGSAYLYHWNGNSWEYQQKIVASSPHLGAPGDWFGYSVSISGDKALVGAFGDDDEGTLEDQRGSAYLYHWNEGTSQWEQLARITASDGQGGDDFGWSVSISGGQATIGAPKSTPYGFSSGSAYLFEWDGLALVEREKLTAFDGEAGDSFGQSVGISGNRAIVGAYREDENSNNAGAAYPFLLGVTGATPELSVTPPAPVCPGEPFDLSTLAVTDANGTNPFLTYHSGTPATPLNELASPIVTPETPSSTYYILGAARSGCTDEVAITLEAPAAPTLTCQDITVELNPFNQQAFVYPDQVASVEPDCPGFTLYFLGGNTALPPLPMVFNGCSSVGEHPVSVFLYNGQGGRRRRVCRATITVIAPPAASCEEGLNVALGQDGTLTLNPTEFNQGSYAICGSIADMTVSPAVLTCADVGTTEVTLTVTTDDGQTASCSTEIGVSPWIGELCDGLDNNCNGIIDDSPIDQDGDGYNICEDCDDTDASLYPGAPEICDGIDNNCNGLIDEGGLVEVLEGIKLMADNSAGDDPNSAVGDGLGISVSISGDWAIVGAFFDDYDYVNNGNEYGAAYFFHLENGSWVQTQKVVPDLNGTIAPEIGWFGFSVSISGDWAIIGAPLSSDGVGGSAYLYRLESGTWVETKRATAGDWGVPSADNDGFGSSVAISGDKAIIGSYNDSYPEGPWVSSAGSAYFLHWDGSNWEPSGKIAANTPAVGELFGFSVSISGNRAIVGASKNAEHESDNGSAYFFYWDGANWIPDGQVFADVPTANSQFGYSVDIDGNRAIVGTFNGEAAYLFHWNGSAWAPDPQEPKLTAYNGITGRFGIGVSISGDMSLVGADNSNNTGAVYPFQWNGSEWLALPTLVLQDPAIQPQDGAGFSVSIDGNRTIVGAPGDDNANGINAGAAYISATVPCGGAIRPAPDPILPPVAQVVEAKTDFILYPNPALEEVFLEFKTPLASAAEVRVYDLAGRPVLRRPLEAGTDKAGLPVQGLVSGLYLLEVKSGAQVFEVKRFVKGGE